MNTTLLSFSFLQGVIAFFAPCAVALLPGYISSFISRNNTHNSNTNNPSTNQLEQSKTKLLLRGIYLAFFIILGFLTIYAVAGTLLYLISPLIKKYISWVAMLLAVGIIVMGIFMLLGKSISLPIHTHFKKSSHEFVEGFLFGIAYGIGALGCLFPLFLIVLTAAISAPSIFEGISYIVAYFAGMSSFMVLFMTLTVFAKQALTKSLSKILPHILRISGTLIILAGTYIIWYQWPLVFG